MKFSHLKQYLALSLFPYLIALAAVGEGWAPEKVTYTCLAALLLVASLLLRDIPEKDSVKKLFWVSAAASVLAATGSMLGALAMVLLGIVFGLSALSIVWEVVIKPLGPLQ